MAFYKWKRTMKRSVAVGLAAAMTVTSCPGAWNVAYAAESEEIVIGNEEAVDEAAIEEASEGTAAEESAQGESDELLAGLKEAEIGEQSAPDVEVVTGEDARVLYTNDMSSVTVETICDGGDKANGTKNGVTDIAVTDLGNDSGNKAVKYTVDYSGQEAWGDVISWYNSSYFTNSDNITVQNAEKILFTFDVYLSTNEFNGELRPKAAVKDQEWTWIDDGAKVTLTKESFTKDTKSNLWKATVDTEITGVQTMTSLYGVIPCLTGAEECNYNGDIYFDNIKVSVVEKEEGSTVTELAKWSTKEDFAKWDSNGAWQYNGPQTMTAVDDFEGSLKLDLDYSQDASRDWSEMKAAVKSDDGFTIAGANKAELDLYLDGTALASAVGDFKVKLWIDNLSYDEAVGIDQMVAKESAEDADNGTKKVHLSFNFSELAENAHTVQVGIVGACTDYKGAAWIDNVVVSSEKSGEDIYVDRTVDPVADNSKLSVADGKLRDVSGNETAIPATVKMVDAAASEITKQTYAYLKAVGDSNTAIFGHQNDTWDKAGALQSENASLKSDTYDVTGDYAGILGMDALSLTGNEYSAEKYKNEFGEDLGSGAQANVKAAAKKAVQAMKNGSIVTLSAHMPNFADVKANKVNADYKEGDPSYTKYDFTGYTPNDLSGDVMQNLLPGGELNEVYTAYLDMIADFAGQVGDKGAILFRPYHENTGSWFWWGAAQCDPQTYKSVYKYTVEYLRDVKGIHNFIYVYGPGSEAETKEEYAERYPGDEYVDMVGFDMYHRKPAADDKWMEDFKKEINVVQSFAEDHGKLFAVTETGVANDAAEGDSQTALLKKENARPDWFMEVQEAVSGTKASYFLVWANFAKNNGFYTPYVEKIVTSLDGESNEVSVPHGHEMMDNFVNYYNDARSVFASDQKGILSDIPTVTAVSASEKVNGYIITPVAGSRILTKGKVKAKVNGITDSTKVTVKMTGEDGVTKTILATKDTDGYYVAAITAEVLDYMGTGTGTIELQADGQTIDKIGVIFNEEKPAEDPYLIDDFEGYYGQSDQLTKKWAKNNAAGSSVKFTLDKENAASGYAMKFEYDEAEGGWGGATINKKVDWSDCNALSFYTIPDGNNQKVVIQITAGGHVYEAYLQDEKLFPEVAKAYRDTKTPLKVTIPFEDFVSRDNDGAGLNVEKADISSFGVWVNAISGTPAMKEGRVSGVIYYDDITAISTDSTEAEVVAQSKDGKVVVDSPVTYTGKKLTPKVIVRDPATGVVLKAGRDYKVSYKNNVNVGKGKVIVKGIKNYKGTNQEAEFDIVPKSLSDNGISVEVNSGYAYKNGKAVKVTPVVKYDGRKLKANKDYTVEFRQVTELNGKEKEVAVAEIKEEGTYRVVVTAKSANYSGCNEDRYFAVTKKIFLSKAKVTLKTKVTAYDGKEKRFKDEEVIVKVGKDTLKKGTDYNIEYADNVDAGRATLTIVATGGGKYYGTKTVNFTIKGTPLKSAVISEIPKTFVYTGETVAPAVTVSYNNAKLNEWNESTHTGDYTVNYGENTNVGKATVTITGKGGFTGTIVKKFKITPAQLSANMVVAESKAVYKTTGAKPEVTVSFNGAVLTENKDYTVKCQKAKSVGDKAKVTIIGKGNFAGTLRDVAEFEVIAKDMSALKVVTEDVQLTEGTEEYKTKVTVFDDGKKLKENKDYTISYEDNKATEATTATVIVKPAEGSSYVGTTSATFRIAKGLLAKTKVTIKSKTFNGTKVTLTKDDITITGSDGKAVDKANYKIVSYSGNDKAGVATVTLKGKGDYVGTKTAKFVILPRNIGDALSALKTFFS